MENNLLQLWLLLGVVLLVIDLISLTIVLLFASIAALSVGGAIYLNIISSTDLQPQLITFFTAYALWAIILFKPLKNLRTKLKTNGGYNDMIGSQAIVEKEISDASQEFTVKWSGTIMKAKLDESVKEPNLKQGDVVQIVSVKGALLTVKPKN